MKPAITTYSIIVILLMTAAKSYGQTDSTRRKSIAYMSQRLNTDTSTAGKVIAIQEGYKRAVKRLISNGSLTDLQRRAAIDSLMDGKNQKLEQLLTLHQRDMIIPASERRRNWQPDTTAHTTH